MQNKTKTIRRISFFILLFTLIFFSTIFAQDTGEIEMADALYSNGKIYIVVGVLSVIFIGLAIYLIRLDRHITKLEKEKK